MARPAVAPTLAIDLDQPGRTRLNRPRSLDVDRPVAKAAALIK